MWADGKFADRQAGQQNLKLPSFTQTPRPSSKTPAICDRAWRKLPEMSDEWVQDDSGGGPEYQRRKLISNWARTFECRPQRFYRPKSEEEVVRIVNLARQTGKVIRVVGAAHSPSDIHCTSGWMLSLDHLNKVVSHDLDRRLITIQAGMRLFQYMEELERRGWRMDNLGSISDQSVAGAISTCTHGSSLEYGPISNQVEKITLVLANGTITTCSLCNDPDLFRAALVSLGSLGVIIRITLRASPQYNLAHTTEVISLPRFLSEYDSIWKSAQYVRAWWWPYTQKVVLWRGNRTQSPQTHSSIPFIRKLSSGLELGKRFYEGSLYALIYAPWLLPKVENPFFKIQFPEKENVVSEPKVDNPHQALQMDCLFSQYVDEWAIPLHSGTEAISRLDKWIRERDTSIETGIPMETDGRVYVHAPIEIRVNSGRGEEAFLSPARDGPVVYIGVIMYRPYFSPIAYRRYFAAYEHLMRAMQGKPHWAKQHSLTAKEAERVFGEGMRKWLQVRERVDRTGLFVNGFVKRHLLDVSESRGVGILDGESGRLYKRYRAVL